MFKITLNYTKWIVQGGLVLTIGSGVYPAAAAVSQSVGGGEAEPLLAQAYTLTASGDKAGADAIYRQLIQCCPDTGFPAYARFLSKTAQTTAVEELLSNDPALAALPPLVRARTYVSAGRSTEAVELLRTPIDQGQSVYQRTLLLSNQLEQLGQAEVAALELEKALGSAELSGPDLRDLFKRLLLVGGSERLSAVIPKVVETVVTSSTYTYPEIRELALAGLTALSMGSTYEDFHVSLKQNISTSPVQAWLFALSSLKKGDSETALATLEAVTSSTMTNNQKSIWLEELATLVALDTSRVISLYEELLPISNDATRIRLHLAQHHFRAKTFPKVVEILKPLDFNELQDGEQQTAMNLYLSSLGAIGPMADLVTELLRLSEKLPYEKVRDIAAAPFIHFSPDNLEGLRTAVEAQVSSSTETAANAYVLLMGLENQTGNHGGMYEALTRYTEARPNDSDAARELANGLASEAWHLVSDNVETSPPLEQLEKAANSASKALWNSIRLKPYSPEPYEKLMALYRLFNQPEKAVEVPKYLSERPNAMPEEVHLAAYVYATQGYPELSIPLYERALTMQDDTRYRLNYAAALGRVGRYEDAMKFYREIIEHGVNGHQYHIHEVHSSALALARKHGNGKEHLDFLMTMLNNKNVPEREVFLLEEGRVLASAGLYQEALHFFYKLKEEFPEEAVSATDIIVSTYAAIKDFDEARRVLSEEISRTTEPASLAFLRNNLALTYRLEGQIDPAVDQWQKLAADLPLERTATRALLNAARALAQTGRIEQARKFYNDFIQLATGDVIGEQLARDEVMRLDRMEVPTSMLVESAMLEYGPAHVDHDHGPGHDLGAAGLAKVESDKKQPAAATGQDDHDDHDDHENKPAIHLDFGKDGNPLDTGKKLNIEGDNHAH